MGVPWQRVPLLSRSCPLLVPLLSRSRPALPARERRSAAGAPGLAEPSLGAISLEGRIGTLRFAFSWILQA